MRKSLVGVQDAVPGYFHQIIKRERREVQIPIWDYNYVDEHVADIVLIVDVVVYSKENIYPLHSEYQYRPKSPGASVLTHGADINERSVHERGTSYLEIDYKVYIGDAGAVVSSGFEAKVEVGTKSRTLTLESKMSFSHAVTRSNFGTIQRSYHIGLSGGKLIFKPLLSRKKDIEYGMLVIDDDALPNRGGLIDGDWILKSETDNDVPVLTDHLAFLKIRDFIKGVLRKGRDTDLQMVHSPPPLLTPQEFRDSVLPTLLRNHYGPS